jgi:rRNA small subunit pseudouridine methyltransferase Nep1
LLTLIIADAALETVPESLRDHTAVRRSAASRGKRSDEVLLDRSYHHAAMLRLKDHSRRGRPDLVHFALLEAAATPLYSEDRLRICVHMFGGKAIFMGEQVRLPRSYLRFVGLMEQLLQEGKVVSGGRRLLESVDMDFGGLVDRIGASSVVGLSRSGRPSGFEAVAEDLASEEDAALVVGGFPRGHFTAETASCLDQVFSVNRRPLEAHVVIARALYEYETQVLGK